MISNEDADASLDESKDWFGRTIAAADGLADFTAERGSRSQQNDGQFHSTDEGLFCGADWRTNLFEAILGKNLPAFLGRIGARRLRVSWLNYSKGDVK